MGAAPVEGVGTHHIGKVLEVEASPGIIAGHEDERERRLLPVVAASSRAEVDVLNIRWFRITRVRDPSPLADRPAPAQAHRRV